ncbi:MAG: hypothetical protein IJ309_05670 [Clostridia bacterium]|nr:hypothetical protein [Clostridia bacterium]
MKKRIIAFALAAILLIITLGTLFLSFHNCHFENGADCVLCQINAEQSEKQHYFLVITAAISILVLTCVIYLHINQRVGDDSSLVKLRVKLTD